jgi:CRISPR/Cas system-associated protein endoribonuclease Cas2
MKPGRKSRIVLLHTSDINEGTTARQKNIIIDDLNLRQLKLTEEQLTKLMLILGGDQSTVEKI